MQNLREAFGRWLATPSADGFEAMAIYEMVDPEGRPLVHVRIQKNGRYVQRQWTPEQLADSPDWELLQNLEALGARLRKDAGGISGAGAAWGDNRPRHYDPVKR